VRNRLKLAVLCCFFPTVVVLGCSGKVRNFDQHSADSGAGGRLGADSAGSDTAGADNAGSDSAGSDNAGSDNAGSDSGGSDNAGSDGAGTTNSGGSGGTTYGGGSGGTTYGGGSGGTNTGGLGGTANTGGLGGTNGGGSGGAACQGETDPAFCQRLAKTCGSVAALDNCGHQRTAVCGSCTAPSTCGSDNTCMSCLQESNSAFCARLGKTCGSVTATDNCGVQRTATCGTCSGTQVCGDKNLCIEPLSCTGTSASGPLSIYNLSGAVAPVPAGGTLVDGFYLATTVNYYGPRDSVEAGTIEVRSGTVRKQYTVYSTSSNSALTGYAFAGSYTLSDKNIVITADNCKYGGTLTVTYGYSSSATVIKLFDTSNGAVSVVTYQLQP